MDVRQERIERSVATVEVLVCVHQKMLTCYLPTHLNMLCVGNSRSET